MRVVEEQYDVVVCGGGLAGFSAAVAAARHGARTVLVHDRPVLGGNSSSEVRVTVHGAAASHAYARETGIISEALIHERAVNHAVIEENGWTNSVWDLTLYDIAMRTENLTLHLNSAVEDVEVQGDRIATVIARTANAETILRLSGTYVVDCTGDGVVGARAGVTSFHGSEASGEFDEPSAPAEASEDTMGSSLHFKTVDTGRVIPYEAPEWAAKYEDPAFFEHGGRIVQVLTSGYWWIEIGKPWHTIYDNEAIRHELTRQTLGIWDYLKNRDPKWAAKAQNLALDWIGQVPGKRESRRLLGEVQLTEHDLRDKDRVFEDEVAFGGWYIDLHTPGGLYAPVAEPLSSSLFEVESGKPQVTKYVGPYGIPLRAMVSKEISNFLFAGRVISSTHAALGSLRVMGTVAAMGQAVGTHAAILIGNGSKRAGDLSAVGKLQQTLLRDGCFLPHVRNDDPLDLARSAKATASSSQEVDGVGPDLEDNLGGLGQWWQAHPVLPTSGRLDQVLTQWIARGPGDAIDKLSVLLENSAAEAREIGVALYRTDGIWDYRLQPGTPLRTGTLRIEAGAKAWIDWEIDLSAEEIGDGGYVRLQLDAAPDVEWIVAPSVLPGQLAGYQITPDRMRRFGGGSSLSFAIQPPQSPYGADHVLSGVTRPLAATNVWRSDPDAALPAWIRLTWEEPVTISQVQITFSGHLLREYHAEPPRFHDPQTVKAYELQAWADGGWQTVASAQENYVNRVVHDLDEVRTDRIRLLITETNGDPSAAVYEIRAYESQICHHPAFQ